VLFDTHRDPTQVEAMVQGPNVLLLMQNMKMAAAKTAAGARKLSKEEMQAVRHEARKEYDELDPASHKTWLLRYRQLRAQSACKGDELTAVASVNSPWGIGDASGAFSTELLCQAFRGKTCAGVASGTNHVADAPAVRNHHPEERLRIRRIDVLPHLQTMQNSGCSSKARNVCENKAASMSLERKLIQQSLNDYFGHAARDKKADQLLELVGSAPIDASTEQWSTVFKHMLSLQHRTPKDIRFYVLLALVDARPMCQTLIMCTRVGSDDSYAVDLDISCSRTCSAKSLTHVTSSELAFLMAHSSSSWTVGVSVVRSRPRSKHMCTVQHSQSKAF
jgi:hypothetical protein